MITVKSAGGVVAPLAVFNLKVTENLLAADELDFDTTNEPINKESFPLIGARSVFTVPENGQMYRITSVSGTENLGDYKKVSVTALHVMNDMNDAWIKNTLTATKSLDTCLHFIFDGSKFDFTVHDIFANYSFSENFGAGRMSDLFLNTLKSDFGFEFTVDNYHIDVYKQVGQRNGFVFFDGDDINTLAESIDYNTIRTQVSGSGKADDNGNPTVSAVYTSPNIGKYGGDVIEADAISDDRFTDQGSLTDYLKKQLHDYPDIQYTANLTNFKKGNVAGHFNSTPRAGDYGYIRDRYGIDDMARVSQFVYYPQEEQQPQITFGTIQDDLVDTAIKTQTDVINAGRVSDKTSGDTELPMITDQDALSHLAQIGGE